MYSLCLQDGAGSTSPTSEDYAIPTCRFSLRPGRCVLDTKRPGVNGFHRVQDLREAVKCGEGDILLLTVGHQV